MLRYALVSALVLLAASGTRAFAAELMSADELAISRIEDEWNEASRNWSKAFYEKYFVDDFTYIDDKGEFINGRAAFISHTMDGPRADEVITSNGMVKVHGTTGVATGRRWTRSSNALSVTRYTNVYAKGSDGWKIVASQETRVK
jgi:ketosteroid isomerase-like protein